VAIERRYARLETRLVNVKPQRKQSMPDQIDSFFVLTLGFGEFRIPSMLKGYKRNQTNEYENANGQRPC
jgi:hypothetical protein